jgi:hypothetical protein
MKLSIFLIELDYEENELKTGICHSYNYFIYNI